MNSTISGIPYSEIGSAACSAAVELDNLRLGRQEAPLTAVSKVADYFSAIIQDEMQDSSTILLVREALFEAGLMEKAVRGDKLLEADAEFVIGLRGVAADLETARRALTIVSNLRDFCLELSKTFSANAGELQS